MVAASGVGARGGSPPGEGARGAPGEAADPRSTTASTCSGRRRAWRPSCGSWSAAAHGSRRACAGSWRRSPWPRRRGNWRSPRVWQALLQYGDGRVSGAAEPARGGAVHNGAVPALLKCLSWASLGKGGCGGAATVSSALAALLAHATPSRPRGGGPRRRPEQRRPARWPPGRTAVALPARARAAAASCKGPAAARWPPATSRARTRGPRSLALSRVVGILSLLGVFASSSLSP